MGHKQSSVNLQLYVAEVNPAPITKIAPQYQPVHKHSPAKTKHRQVDYKSDTENQTATSIKTIIQQSIIDGQQHEIKELRARIWKDMVKQPVLCSNCQQVAIRPHN